MFTVALLGPDGAGKTTIAKKLRDNLPWPAKYMYMHMNITSSNISLPTSRFIHALKSFLSKNQHSQSDTLQRPEYSLTQDETRELDNRGAIGATARLFYRISEELFRQLMSWIYQTRGFVVLFDRHFVFDYAVNPIDHQDEPERYSDIVHRWFLNHLYSKPDLVILLDAPAEILFARKGEWTLAYLKSRRQAFLQQGEKTTNFVKIDASQPLDEVFNQVLAQVVTFGSRFSGND